MLGTSTRTLVISTSTLTPDGFGNKERDFDTTALRKSGTKHAKGETFVALVRRWWEEISNSALEWIGATARVDRRSRAHRCREAWRMGDIEAAYELEGPPLEYLGKERFEKLRAAGLQPCRRNLNHGSSRARALVHVPETRANPRPTGHIGVGGDAFDREFQEALDELTSCLDKWHSIDEAFMSAPGIRSQRRDYVAEPSPAVQACVRNDTTNQPTVLRARVASSLDSRALERQSILARLARDAQRRPKTGSPGVTASAARSSLTELQARLTALARDAQRRAKAGADRAKALTTKNAPASFHASAEEPNLREKEWSVRQFQHEPHRQAEEEELPTPQNIR